MNRLQTYLSFVRFSHSVFALPFALTGALLALQQYPAPGREIVPVSVLSEHEQEVPLIATLSSQKLSQARAECVGFTVDSSLLSDEW